MTIVEIRLIDARAGDWLVNWAPADNPAHKPWWLLRGRRSCYVPRTPAYCLQHGCDCVVMDGGEFLLYGRGSDVVTVARMTQ